MRERSNQASIVKVLSCSQHKQFGMHVTDQFMQSAFCDILFCIVLKPAVSKSIQGLLTANHVTDLFSTNNKVQGFEE